MAKEEEYREWLKAGGAQNESAHHTRTYAIRTIEKNLSALGFQYQDLEEAWNAEGFDILRQRIRDIRDDAQNGGQDYRILMPEAENPYNRLSNWASWLGQYGRFLAGDPPGPRKDADRIRQHVLEEIIEPAREEGLNHVEVLVRDVNTALGLNEAWPNICQALGGRIFQEYAEVSAPDRIGADQSSATVFRFDLKGDTVRTDKRLFVLFDTDGNKYQPVRNFNRTSGKSAFRIKPSGAGNSAAEAIETESIEDVARAMLVDGLATRIKPIAGGNVNYLTFPGKKLVRYELDPEIAKAIGMPSQSNKGEFEKTGIEIVSPIELEPETSSMNIIFYGPPGTGKTYQTAAEAVKLCGEDVPENRPELMQIYRHLLAAGRIEFVTFHQAMSYEDFVEGRQPMTGSDDREETGTVGFRLETIPGVFRRVAKRAEISKGLLSGTSAISVDRQQIFKMSIGRANAEEDAHYFEEAIENGYALLGWEDIDWSDDKFGDAREIFAECLNEGKNIDQLTPQSGAVRHTDQFRNRLKIGDIIIVSKGNGLFRAIGEVAGEYEFHPRPEGDYAHRRAVKWLWKDTDGVPVQEIYRRNFTQPTIYRLDKESLILPALERYINSGQDNEPSAPQQFVLIIDEINRANISKVFGELITLLEPDKRLGKMNALKVRLPYSGDEFGVPANLHILGTMNTADRSIALLDTALRRRFTFREMMPNPSVLTNAAERSGIDLPKLLMTVNERIEYLYDREHQIGHAYFSACNNRDDVDAVMRHKVIPLLAEYFFEDWAKIALVLGDLEQHDNPISGGFLNRSVLKAPPGLDEDDAALQFRWRVRTEEEGFDYSKLAVE